MRRPYAKGGAVAVAVVALAGAAVFLPSGGAFATQGSSQSTLVVAPNHHVAAKPGSGKPGGGKPGGGHGGGLSWPGWASSNWSGYAVTGSYTSATGRWTVPSVARTKQSTYSAAWVGIGGFVQGDGSLIQLGTEQDFRNGSPHYSAWWTTSDLGYAEQPISDVTVRAGDQIDAAVTDNNDGTWTLSLQDGGQVFSKTVSFTSSGLSAEWIMEAPAIGGRVAPLAHYGSDVFDPGTVNGGQSPAFTNADGGVLVQQQSVVSIPSTPDIGTNEGDGFAIAYGSQQPSPPAS